MDLPFLTEPMKTLSDRAAEQFSVLRAQADRRFLGTEA
jgi:hypothetical protein